MSTLDYKSFTERRRPHIHPAGATLFVTYRLAGSIPQGVVRAYKAKRDWLENELTRARKQAIAGQSSEQTEGLRRVAEFHREWFLKFEDALHKAKSGPMWLKDEPVVAKVVENLHRLDGDAYRLDA